MVITSENSKKRIGRYGNTQFRFSLTTVVVTFAILLFLNYYCSRTNQRVIYQSKQKALVEKCHIAAVELSTLEVINKEAVAATVQKIGGQDLMHLIITDKDGIALYDSAQEGSYTNQVVSIPEIQSALQCNDAFRWTFKGSNMRSQAAVPIFSYGELSGCVYLAEEDPAQAKLLQSLQVNILTISIILELLVIIISFGFSKMFSSRMRKILNSIRIIRGGDYSHKVKLSGHDEMAVLGEEFNDLTDKLQISEYKRRQFVSDASHELKTPLASIKLLTDSILQNPMDTETTIEFVEDIGREADRLTRMTAKLLSLTKTEAAYEESFEIITMAPTVNRVVRMLEGIAQENEIQITVNIRSDTPVLITEDDLYQITFNLVENGIKYNTPGGKLDIELFREDENSVLTITDSGIGIPQDALPYIFQRFYRVDKARSRKSGGSGLGLSIVHNMVERNSGTIHVSSEAGKGTQFRVSFPVFDTDEDAQ